LAAFCAAWIFTSATAQRGKLALTSALWRPGTLDRFATFELATQMVDGTFAMEMIRRSLTSLGVLAGHPLAFLAVLLYGVAWVLLDRDHFGWHGFAVLATWFMTLLIQRAEYRDTQAIQAKLDELLHAQSRAQNDLTHIDEEEPEDIERHRAVARQND